MAALSLDLSWLKKLVEKEDHSWWMVEQQSDALRSAIEPFRQQFQLLLQEIETTKGNDSTTVRRPFYEARKKVHQAVRDVCRGDGTLSVWPATEADVWSVEGIGVVQRINHDQETGESHAVVKDMHGKSSEMHGLVPEAMFLDPAKSPDLYAKEQAFDTAAQELLSLFNPPRFGAPESLIASLSSYMTWDETAQQECEEYSTLLHKQFGFNDPQIFFDAVKREMANTLTSSKKERMSVYETLVCYALPSTRISALRPEQFDVRAMLMKIAARIVMKPAYEAAQQTFFTRLRSQQSRD